MVFWLERMEDILYPFVQLNVDHRQCFNISSRPCPILDRSCSGMLFKTLSKNFVSKLEESNPTFDKISLSPEFLALDNSDSFLELSIVWMCCCMLSSVVLVLVVLTRCSGLPISRWSRLFSKPRITWRSLFWRRVFRFSIFKLQIVTAGKSRDWKLKQKNICLSNLRLLVEG